MAPRAVCSSAAFEPGSKARPSRFVAQFADKLVWIDAFVFALRADDESVSQYDFQQLIDLGGGDGRLAANGGNSLAGAEQAEGTARAGAEQQGRVLAGLAHPLEDMVANTRTHFHRADRFLTFEDHVGGSDWLEALDGVSQLEAFAHLFFVLERRVAQADAHEKAVDLRFGQTESAFVFDWVLRGDDHKGPLHAIGDALDRDQPFAH